MTKPAPQFDPGAVASFFNGAIDTDRFIADVVRYRVIGAHPLTIASLRSHPRFEEALRGVRLEPLPWVTPGEVVTGEALRNHAVNGRRVLA